MAGSAEIHSQYGQTIPTHVQGLIHFRPVCNSGRTPPPPYSLFMLLLLQIGEMCKHTGWLALDKRIHRGSYHWRHSHLLVQCHLSESLFGRQQQHQRAPRCSNQRVTHRSIRPKLKPGYDDGTFSRAAVQYPIRKLQPCTDQECLQIMRVVLVYMLSHLRMQLAYTLRISHVQ